MDDYVQIRDPENLYFPCWVHRRELLPGYPAMKKARQTVLDCADARHLAWKTAKRYAEIVLRFAEAIAPEPPDRASVKDIERYLAALRREGKSASTMNQAISALTFYYREGLGQNIRIPFRPRKDLSLPRAMTEPDVQTLLASEKDTRNRLIYALAYGCGLRVCEIARLRVDEIETVRRVVWVRRGKGRKDRMTILPQAVAGMLETYLAECDPEGWLFPGSGKSGHLSTRAIQAAFSDARARCRIRTGKGIHSLRHSFAVSLLEAGTPVPHVQSLLGHQSLATTAVYSHLSTGGALATASPMDRT